MTMVLEDVTSFSWVLTSWVTGELLSIFLSIIFYPEGIFQLFTDGLFNNALSISGCIAPHGGQLN
jgi:hypothetical protein